MAEKEFKEIDYSKYGDDFVELESDDKELLEQGINGSYWKPDTIGQTVAGNVLDILEGQYGDQILLELYHENDDINELEIELPAHKDIQDKTKDLEVGEFIVVSLVKIIPNNNPEYSDKKVYKIVKVPSRRVEYEE